MTVAAAQKSDRALPPVTLRRPTQMKNNVMIYSGRVWDIAGEEMCVLIRTGW
jgi:hypothetical protein